MNTISLSGWGQPADALERLGLGCALPYAACNNITQALELIASEAKNAMQIVGWSLGGQLALRAVVEKRIQPKNLVLIGAPYQFVETESVPLGMKWDSFTQFKENYARNPLRTLHKAHALIALGDEKNAKVRHYLEMQDMEALTHIDWHYWLEVLEEMSCAPLSFHDFPSLLLIHGENDAVVNVAAAHAFHGRIPHAQLHIIPGCGHAPHWHDINRIQSIITEIPQL